MACSATTSGNSIVIQVVNALLVLLVQHTKHKFREARRGHACTSDVASLHPLFIRHHNAPAFFLETTSSINPSSPPGPCKNAGDQMRMLARPEPGSWGGTCSQAARAPWHHHFSLSNNPPIFQPQVTLNGPRLSNPATASGMVRSYRARETRKKLSQYHDPESLVDIRRRYGRMRWENTV